MKKLSVLLVMLSLVVATGVAHAAPPLQDAAEGAEYVVQSGDSLSRIAGRFLGSRNAFKTIVEATNAKAADDDSFATIEDANVLAVGQKLWIPGVDEDAIAAVETSEAEPQAAEGDAADDTASAEGTDDTSTTEEGDVAEVSETETADVAGDTDATIEAAAETETGLGLDALRNASYSGVYENAVTLTDGTFEGQPFVEGGASRPTLTLTEFVEFGDLNGDGVQDAAAVLVESSGGSGVFNYLAVVVDQDGTPVNVATHLLGDRTTIEKFFIENDQIGVDMITQGPDDALCCPTLKVTRRYQWQNGALVNLDGEMTASHFASTDFQPASEMDGAMAEGEATEEAPVVEYSVVSSSIVGDVTGDGKNDGVAVLSSSSDAGTVYELVAVANQGGTAVVLARLTLDGVPSSVSVDANSQIVVDTSAGSQSYQLQGNQLVEVNAAEEEAPVEDTDEDTQDTESSDDTSAGQQV